MSRYLSPIGIQETFDISRATAYRILKKFEEHGGEVIRIGKLPRVSEEQFTEYLREISHEEHS